jgi:cytoskeletal protein CcmA (bactofilin family)
MIKIKGLAEDLNGFMDEGTEFIGELRFRDTFRVDGRVKGKIVSENTLVVGETARIEADIDCGTISIKGSVTGRVQGRQRVELLTGAKLHGTIISPRLVIEEGAYFEGDCDMSASTKNAVVPLASPRAATGSERT